MNILTKAMLGASVVAIALVGAPGTALAQHRHDDVGQGTLSAQFDYGIWTGDGNLNGYGAGLGLRGGYTLDMGLYLGGDFDYFFGESDSAGVLGIAGASNHLNVWNVMGEVGYDFWVHRHGILRPKLGLGVGIARGSFCANAIVIGSACNSDSSTGFAIAPGVQYLHFFDNIYFSGELRFETMAVDGPDPSAFIFGIGIGVAL